MKVYKYLPVVLIVIVLCLITFFAVHYALPSTIEDWTSPGTLVQLETSHVPTEDDVRMAIRERKRIHRDLIDLTGSA